MLPKYSLDLSVVSKSLQIDTYGYERRILIILSDYITVLPSCCLPLPAGKPIYKSNHLSARYTHEKSTLEKCKQNTRKLAYLPNQIAIVDRFENLRV